MTSTFFGLVAGIVIAAYLTTQYSELMNRHLNQLLAPHENAVVRNAPITAQTSATESEPAVTAQPVMETPEVVPQGGSQPEPAQQPEPEPRKHPAANALDEMEQRWVEFAQQADTLQPVGDFRWRDCFTRAAAAHGVPEPLLLAIASGESDFDPAARSDKDAIGVMQIRWPDTSHHLGIIREADLYDPCTNISAGARYIAELTELFGNNLHRAVAAYNYGPGRIAGKAMPQGARWYSQYIYQHLQRVLDRPHVPSSELLPPRAGDGPGFELLIAFNQAYRARDYKEFLESQIPGIELAYRSELPGQHEVVLLYQDDAGRRRALEAIRATGLLAARLTSDRSISL
jgi:soluble lytic murein transglycosylase-like protein